MIRDRADELAARRDVWPAVAEYLGEARREAVAVAEDYLWGLGLISDEDLEAKFRRGEAEHDRGWLSMSREALEAEIVAEIADLVLYIAMIRARFVDDSESSPAVPWDMYVDGVRVEGRPTGATAPPFLSNRDPGDEA